jgi:hypothetical protein
MAYDRSPRLRGGELKRQRTTKLSNAEFRVMGLTPDLVVRRVRKHQIKILAADSLVQAARVKTTERKENDRGESRHPEDGSMRSFQQRLAGGRDEDIKDLCEDEQAV